MMEDVAGDQGFHFLSRIFHMISFFFRGSVVAKVQVVLASARVSRLAEIS